MEGSDRIFAQGDIVMGLFHKGRARTLPEKILLWHEIVNDTVGGDNISVTYCPLTGTGIGFFRGDAELGVSGRLINSNMLYCAEQCFLYLRAPRDTDIKRDFSGQLATCVVEDGLMHYRLAK